MTTWMVEGEKSLTPASWVLEAWRDLPEEMVARSFKKCGISNSTDGTEDNMLWEEEEATFPDEKSVDQEKKKSVD